ncbi:Helicase associated domain protein [Streptomyces sp. NPDC006529]|uniref:DEAD/DEAH box helicase n=1 Tax=Streptomyces sp. NPDC006529 TaxID=3157177 RepID=UPI0033B951FC
MARKVLRPHQREAVDAVVRALELPPGGQPPEAGLRTQVIMATGSGKSLVAVRSAEALGAGRVLVLVPSLDLLVQSVAAWRDGGRTGRFLAVCSLRGPEAGVPSTTDPERIAAWCRPVSRVTVFATYASLGLGIVERAHLAGLPAWDLVVVDEAHRTSGRIGKPWAVVHDNARIPAVRRLYMTATPRIWQDPETTGDLRVSPAFGGSEEAEGPQGPAGSGAASGPRSAGGRAPGGALVASMEDDPDGPFGARCHTLSLSEAIDRGICAPYQVVCVDVSDPEFQAAVLLGPEGRSDAVRGARLAALQTALVKAAAEQGFRRTLVFHHLTREAEAFAAGLPAVAARLRMTSRAPRPVYPRTVWADWLGGQHPAAHRRRVLDAFAADRIAEKAFLGSVRVLGEGVDTKECDSVFWADVRDSMPDLVQAVGRALRIRPGEGKVASLVVPVLLEPGETPETMLTSRAYGSLARLLEALRAHDSRLVESLAQPQRPSRTPAPPAAAGAPGAPGAAARALLSFSTPRDPALLAAFVRLRVLHPEHEHWRRGLAAAAVYAAAAGDLKVPFGFKAPSGGEGWPPGLARFPLGQWISDARRAYRRGALGRQRTAELDALGMVWSAFDVAFEEGLSAARAWAAAHGHLLPPVEATWEGHPVGVWVKNQRAAARREGPGALSPERREALDDIDPGWCPDWDISWQRAYRLTRMRLEAGGTLPTGPGEAFVQGEDLGQWLRTQRLGWDRLTGAQRWLLEHTLGTGPAEESERPRPRRAHADAWAANLAAARRFREREGHLRVPRTHVEPLGGEQLRLGSWIANQRSRAAALSPERRAALSELGMRWAS